MGDWDYIRAAAIARRGYLRKGTGVGSFKKIFGGRGHRGTRPEKFATGSGSIARHCLKQLEALKILEKVEGGKGRQITAQGSATSTRSRAKSRPTSRSPLFALRWLVGWVFCRHFHFRLLLRVVSSLVFLLTSVLPKGTSKWQAGAMYQRET